MAGLAVQVSWYIDLKGSQDFFSFFYLKWDVKNDFAYVLQFFSLISDGLGSVHRDVKVLILMQSTVRTVKFV